MSYRGKGIKLFLFILTLFCASVRGAYSASYSGLFQDGDPYLAFADEMPEVAGGLHELYKRIVYPDIAKKTGIEGKVYAQVYVNEKGGVDDVKIIKGIGGGCDEAAIDAIKKSKFSPGKNKGTPVKVKLSIPVVFKIK